MKKIFSILLSAICTAGMTFAFSTGVAAADPVNLVNEGTIITSSANDVSAAFDGTLAGTTLGGAGNNYWMGVQLDKPYILSYVRLATRDTDGDGTTEKPWHIHMTVVEGSNDGENWEFIMKFGEPYSEYEDFAAGHGTGNNYWTEYAFDGETSLDNDATTPVAYKYYRVWNDDGSDNWGEVEFWGTTVEDAPNTMTMWNGDTVYTGVDATSVNGSVSGEIIGGGASADALTNAFDGDIETVTGLDANSGNLVEHWFGIKADSPVVPTVIRVSLATSNKDYNLNYTYFQASNDGINWTTLWFFNDWSSYQGYVPGTYFEIPVSTDTAYTYFRAFNWDDRGANRLSEFQVFGPEGILSNNVNKWIGDIVYTGVDATSACGSVTGEIIGGGADASALANAFDGDINTTTVLNENAGEDVSYWMGIMTDSPVVPAAFRISVAPHHYIFNSYIQGSNDGINWTTLKDLSSWKEYATPGEGGNWPAEDVYKIIEVSTSEAYQYFRYFNYDGSGSNTLAEFQVFGAEGITHPNTEGGDITDATITDKGAVSAVVCKDCGTVLEDGYELPALANAKGANLVLDGVIGVNFYVDVDESLVGSTVTLTINGRTFEYDAVASGEYRCNVYAKEMTDTITLAIDGTVLKEYTVKENAEALINGDYTESAKTLAKAMLNYGAYAQLYFGYNTSLLANENCADNDLSVSDDFASYNTKKKTIEGVGTFTAVYLYLDEETTLNAHFVPAEGVDMSAVEFACSDAGVALNKTDADSVYVISITGIGANELENSYTISVGGDSFTCSVFDYIKLVLNKSDNVALQNVMKALYLYNAAANNY